MSSNRNFLDTMHFLYNVGKCYGLSCYSISKGRIKYRVSFEITDFLQLASFIAVYLTLIYYNCVNEWDITNDAKNSVIFNRGQQILIIISLALLVAGTFQIVLMRQQFWDIANLLHGIDNQVYVQSTQPSRRYN